MAKKYMVLKGDCLDRLKELPDNSIDSVVTDPPYGLSKEPDIVEVLTKWMNGKPYDHGHGGFMGKSWDSFVPHPDIWREVFRVLKPGGHALVFAGTRTQDLMTIALRLAGFEVRDVIEWLYFSGFPKSMDVSKAFDKREGIWRGRAGKAVSSNGSMSSPNYERTPKGEAATELAKKWDGWGTATKPSHEPVIVVTKPKTVEDILDEKLKEVANCLSLFVKIAVQNSALNLQDYVEELDFARNRVEPKNNIQDVLSEVTDMSQLKTITESINWNIALSCLITLGDRLKNGNMSTTEMVLNTIIELKTLKYFQSLTTLEFIIKDATNQSGERMNAETVAGHLNEELSRLSEILKPHVPESVISKQDEKGSSYRHEPIIVARKPLEGTVCDNVEKYGTGAINVGECRIGDGYDRASGGLRKAKHAENEPSFSLAMNQDKRPMGGRFPANIVTTEPDAFWSKYCNVTQQELSKKASKRDRNSDWRGDEIALDERVAGGLKGRADGSLGKQTFNRNTHPTVKPVDLMAWLVRLVTPPGGTVLDPFAGSGSTLVAAKREGFGFIGIEREPEYVEIIEARTGTEASQ